MSKCENKRVALVLGSGGARGLAHIGAIEALEERGYKITSVSGCSMGSIIAGMFCAGKLKEAKEWFLSVDRQRILQLTDFSITGNSLVKGSKVIKALQEIVPECRIESLPVPLTLVASDLITSDEVVFREGWLFEAIRASISIPLFFQPVQTPCKSNAWRICPRLFANCATTSRTTSTPSSAPNVSACKAQ